VLPSRIQRVYDDLSVTVSGGKNWASICVYSVFYYTCTYTDHYSYYCLTA
jgi:hypothetical protein